MLDEKYLIPFKVKAWCELSARRKAGEESNSRHIRKHHRDVHKLLTLLPTNAKNPMPDQLKADMQEFFDGIEASEIMSEDIDNAALCRRLGECILRRSTAAGAVTNGRLAVLAVD